MNGPLGNNSSLGLDAFFQYLGSGVQFFSGTVFYLIIIKIFDTSDVGAISLFTAITGLFNVIFSLGLGTAAQHFTSYSIGRGDFRTAVKTFHKILKYGFATSGLGFLTLFLLSPYISFLFLHSYQYIYLVKLLSLVLVGNILFGILNGTLLGLRNFRLSALVNIVIWVTYYFGTVLLAYKVRDLDTIIIGWTIGIFLGVGVLLAVILIIIKDYESHVSEFKNTNILKYSIPVLLSGLIGYGAIYADRFVVAGLLNLSSLGVYNLSLLIASSISFIAVPFNNILLSSFSELYGNNRLDEIKLHVKASSAILSSVFVPAALGISALSPFIVEILGGSNYLQGSAPLAIIMFASALFVTANILSQAVASVRKTKTFIYVSSLSLIANILISFLLIPPYGIIGAAFGFSSVYAVTYLTLMYFARKEGVFSIDVVGTLKIWIASLIMYVAVLSMSFFLQQTVPFTIIYVFAGVLIYILMIRVLSVFKNIDSKFVITLFPVRFRFMRSLISFFMRD